HVDGTGEEALPVEEAIGADDERAWHGHTIACRVCPARAESQGPGRTLSRVSARSFRRAASRSRRGSGSSTSLVAAPHDARRDLAEDDDRALRVDDALASRGRAVAGLVAGDGLRAVARVADERLRTGARVEVDRVRARRDGVAWAAATPRAEA